MSFSVVQVLVCTWKQNRTFSLVKRKNLQPKFLILDLTPDFEYLLKFKHPRMNSEHLMLAIKLLLKLRHAFWFVIHWFWADVPRFIRLSKYLLSVHQQDFEQSAFYWKKKKEQTKLQKSTWILKSLEKGNLHLSM